MSKTVPVLAATFVLLSMLPASSNAAPAVANDDMYMTDEDMTLTVDAADGVIEGGTLGGVADTGDDPLTASLLSNPSHGTLTFNSDGSFEYEPNPDFNGLDEFFYLLTDTDGDTDAGKVTIDVMAQNDDPVAKDDFYTVSENTTLTVSMPGVLANDTDIDEDPLEATLLVDVTHGELTLDLDGSFEYTPKAGFIGVDSFRYEVSDGTSTDEALVTITVNPVVDEASQLCFVVNPPNPIPGQSFTVTVTIDGTPPEVPDVLMCPATGEGFEASVCAADGGFNVSGIFSGQVGLTYNSPDDAVRFQSVVLGSGGIGQSVNFPTSVFTFSSQGDNFVRFSFTVPVPSPDAPSNSESSAVTGAGAIATFTFFLAADADPFTMGIDPANTSFPLGSTNDSKCAIPLPPGGFAEGEWPYESEPAGLITPGFPLTTISGTVKFWNCVSPTTVPVTTLTLDTNPRVAGVDPIKVISNSGNGTYTFNVTPDRAYQLVGDASTLGRGVFRADLPEHFSDEPTITDVTHAITATDVGNIMLYWNDPVGFPLDACAFNAPDCGGMIFPQRVAADVNGWKDGIDCPADTDAGKITGQDASILQQVIAARILGGGVMPQDYPVGKGCTSNWKFFCDTEQFGVIPQEGVVFDPVGVLIGDVNGSYTNNPTVARKPMSGTTLSIPVVSTRANRVTIPVELQQANGVVGVEAKVLYDPKVLRFVRGHAPVSPETDAPANHAWALSNDQGAIAIVVTGLDKKLEGTSTVALLEFERVDPDAERASSPLLITNALADDLTLATDDGFFSTKAVVSSTWGEIKNLYR